MTYPLVSISQYDVEFHNLKVMSVLEMAKIKSNHFEHQLTHALASITSNSYDFLRMTCEERYAFYLSYLDITRDKNGLSQTIDPNAYLSEDLTKFNSAERFEGNNGVTVRHLTGMEAMALEIGCENSTDWIMGVMGLTIGCEKLPALDIPTDVKFTGNIIKNRINILQSLDADEFNELFLEFMRIQDKQDHLVHMVFDSGIVLEQFEKRGADDAPVRFRPDIAFKGPIKELFSLVLRGNPKLQQ
jgi:hypothetical protein